MDCNFLGQFSWKLEINGISSAKNQSVYSILSLY